MGRTAVQATGVERTFAPDELIVSKTDTKGIIRYANSVFQRISGYAEAELIGQPHNIVRHPDMPRTVFKLLWDTLHEGHEVFAYINNLAADGAHYWVLAHVTPSRDRAGRVVGYHSNRRHPAPTAVRAAAELYALLRAEERRHRGGHEALDAGTALLTRALAERGQDYDRFVWSITPTEVGR